ncbi:hypothetical protein [Photobacterium ganghwense]|uniref:hypothetical protein n=1 Tax=Photobacterium ganghwense TaxID=320778 RepID=UPI0039EE2C19
MKCVFDGVINNTPIDECKGVVFLEPHDVVNNQSPQFNVDTFSIVLGALLFAFVTGHVIGRVMRLLGKY